MLSTLLSLQVTDEQLSRYASVIYQATGIRISPQKKMLLSNRLRRRLRALDMDCYDKYLTHLQGLDRRDPEWNAFLEEITTHETYLYRDPVQWEWLSTSYLPKLQAAARRGARARTLRVWSAACSTGDEAYTIACSIADRLVDHAAWKIEIVGTDIGAGALEKAKATRFNERAMRFVPDGCRRRFFTREPDDSASIAKPVLSQWITFRQHNLLQPMKEGNFDLVFLKNVMIYFDVASKQRVVANIERALRTSGMLVTGPAEGVSDLLAGFERLQSWLHRKRVKSHTE